MGKPTMANGLAIHVLTLNATSQDPGQPTLRLHLPNILSGSQQLTHHSTCQLYDAIGLDKVAQQRGPHLSNGIYSASLTPRGIIWLS